MTKLELKTAQVHRDSSFVIRTSSFRGEAAFTILELLIVITIIIILAGLTIATMGYVQGKARRSRAEAEIAGISAALENYKADNGAYPTTAGTNALDPVTTVDPAKNDLAKYKTACFDLYIALTGDINGDRQTGAGETGKSYMAFRPNQLSPSNQKQAVQFIQDPFANSYGYSTMKASGGNGYNPTFDLWSTAGGTKAADMPGWVKNW